MKPKWTSFGSQNRSKIDAKSDQLFDWVLDVILMPKSSPKWFPEPSKITQKSIQNEIWSPKRDFLKNSTAPRRNAHFWGSWELKTIQKTIKNASGISQKCNQNYYCVFIRLLLDLCTILAPKMHAKWFQKSPQKCTEKNADNSSKNDAKLMSKIEAMLPENINNLVKNQSETASDLENVIFRI